MLSLIDEKKPAAKKRGDAAAKPASALPRIGGKPPAAKPATAAQAPVDEPARKSVEDAKKEALNLFDE